MNYRIADFSDIERLVEIRLLYIMEDLGECSDTTLAALTDSLRSYFAAHLNVDMFAFIAEEDGIAVGSEFLVICEKPANPSFKSGRTGTVLNVYTRPEYRRRGIAKRLMEMLLDCGRSEKLDFIELKATVDGRELYSRLGFEETTEHYTPMKYKF